MKCTFITKQKTDADAADTQNTNNTIEFLVQTIKFDRIALATVWVFGSNKFAH